MKPVTFFSTDLQLLQRQLDSWRRQQTGGPRLPPELWAPAAALVRAHGVSHVSRLLRLGFHRLRAEGEELFAQLLKEHHYLGYCRPVGEHLKYLVFAGTRPIACLGWSSAPLKLDLRDRFVGAPKDAYRHHLHLIAYNTLYLLVPWLEVPHLASHLMARVARRIRADWQALYHHPVHLLESFVDTERFQGTCYRAAGWICVGRSEGRAPSPSRVRGLPSRSCG